MHFSDRSDNVLQTLAAIGCITSTRWGTVCGVCHDVPHTFMSAAQGRTVQCTCAFCFQFNKAQQESAFPVIYVFPARTRWDAAPQPLRRVCWN